MSSAFGPRKAPTSGASSFHRGCDFPTIGQVRAVAPGRVVVVGTPQGWSAGGRQVWIQHDGYFTKSLHLGSTAVSVGQWVDTGQYLGAQDTTGTATGSHLHFELTPGNLHYRNDGQVNPVDFIRARITTGSVAGGSIYDQWGGKAWITAIQDKLRRLGYEITVDGQDGPQTQGAVRDFQGKNGLTVDGVAGPLTNAKLDERLAAPIGGVVDGVNRAIVDIQKLVGANPDGIYGPATTAKVMAWQQANGLVPDGWWGPASDAKGFPNVVGTVKLAVDGELGPLTIKALQVSLGFTGADVDGEMGPKTISALQKAVGATVDGVLGPETIKALQRSLGVAVDGDWGPLTTKALQTLLNNGGRLLPVAGTPEAPLPPYPAVTPRACEYPGAARAWNVPLALRLNTAKDGWVPDTRARGKVTALVLHHTTNLGSEEPFFKTANSRGSCPTGYIELGQYIGLIPLTLKPSSTGDGVNEFTAALEIRNTQAAPNWETSTENLERVADYAAWMASKNGQDITYEGVTVRVEFTLDRDHIFGDKEATAKTGIQVRPTECPGPFIMSKLDWVIERAKYLLAAKYSQQPEPDPDPEPDVVTIPRAKWNAITAAAGVLMNTIDDAA